MKHPPHHYEDRFVDYLILVFILFVISYLVLLQPNWVNNIKSYAGDVFTWIIMGAETLAFGFILWLIWHSCGQDDESESLHQPFTPRL